MPGRRRNRQAHFSVRRISLSAPGGGEGRVRWGIPERLPTPTSPSHSLTRVGPSLSPLKGGEGLAIRGFVTFRTPVILDTKPNIRAIANTGTPLHAADPSDS